MARPRGKARRADLRLGGVAPLGPIGPRGRPATVATRDHAARSGVPWTWMALVAVAALAVYANSLGGGLVYDDVNAIRNNPFVRNADIAGILTKPSWWGGPRGPLWRPLTTLTFALDHALHGFAPFGYHVVNVALHAAVSVLLLVVFAIATGAPRVALAATLLFATHPIHTEAVANVVGRAELIAAGGFFLAWRCWLAADAAAARKAGAATGWTVAAVAAFFLAMCGKENAIALPAVLVLADLVVRRTESVAALVRRRLPAYAALAAAAVAFVALRAAVLGQITPAVDLLDNPLGALPLGARILTAIKVVGLYGLRLLFPLWLSADYSFDQVTAATSPLDPGFLGGIAIVGAAVALAWWGWRRLPALALGLGMLGLTFAVVANLFFLVGTIMGERLAYLPSAGFCLALGAGLAHAGGEPARAAGRVVARWPLGFALPLAAMAALYGLRTIDRNAVWHDPLVFFETMASDAPRSARSHRELGTALADVGRFADARAAFERSLAIKPGDAATLYNLGNALGREGRLDDAVDAYQRAITIKPNFVEALENLGNAESMRGDQQAALAAMRRARELTPRSPLLLMNIANTLFRAGSTAEARTTYEEALAVAPDSTEILTNYGSFLYAQGDLPAAARAFERIPAPAPARALVVLAASYQALGRLPDARRVQADAERLYPADPGVRQLAGVLSGAAAASP